MNDRTTGHRQQDEPSPHHEGHGEAATSSARQHHAPAPRSDRPSERAVVQSALGDLADIPAASRWVRSREVRLHVLDYGGDNIPLIILPGITTPAVAMDFVARRLTDLVRPIVVDMRGRGLSDSAASYGLPDYADDVVAVATGLRLDRPLLLGHSMGARVAALAAAHRASDFSGSVLVDPPMSGPGRSPYPVTLAAFLDQLATAHGVTPDEIAHQWPSWPRREQELRARWLSSCDVEAVAATHRGFETEDFFAFWPQVPAPVVLMYGGDSPVVTPADAAAAAAANPAAHLIDVPAAGHMVFWDAPDAAVASLRQVLTAWTRGEGRREGLTPAAMSGPLAATAQRHDAQR